MLETAKKLSEEMKDVVDFTMKEMFTEDMENFMDEITLALLAKMYRILQTSSQLMVEQAEMIEDTNKKVTALLKKAESK